MNDMSSTPITLATVGRFLSATGFGLALGTVIVLFALLIRWAF